MNNPLFNCLTIDSEPFKPPVRIVGGYKREKKKRDKQRRNKKGRPPVLLKAADYERYIKSDAWYKRRAQYFSLYDECCAVCSERRHIHLHHMTYKRLGCEKDTDLVPLCSIHHDEYHKKHAHASVKTTLKWIEETRDLLFFTSFSKNL